jgi:hypothetical protein
MSGQGSGDLLPPSPPSEQTTASQDQAGQSGTGILHRQRVALRAVSVPR